MLRLVQQHCWCGNCTISSFFSKYIYKQYIYMLYKQLYGWKLQAASSRISSPSHWLLEPIYAHQFLLRVNEEYKCWLCELIWRVLFQNASRVIPENELTVAMPSSTIVFWYRIVHIYTYMHIYVHIYEEFFSTIWSLNLALTLQHRFFFYWCLTRFGKELFIYLLECPFAQSNYDELKPWLIYYIA